MSYIVHVADVLGGYMKTFASVGTRVCVLPDGASLELAKVKIHTLPCDGLQMFFFSFCFLTIKKQCHHRKSMLLAFSCHCAAIM